MDSLMTLEEVLGSSQRGARCTPRGHLGSTTVGQEAEGAKEEAQTGVFTVLSIGRTGPGRVDKFRIG